ncbi:hypothetical protein, partial [Streptomyces anthocyanicus]|uniref:hypothetical protein n=1 Tax=Streptomyces anthocyanicus TaxID=68174 RepID=UPI001C702746
GRFPSVLRFRLYQIFPIRFPRRFPGSRFRVSLSGGSDFIRTFEPVLPAFVSDSSGECFVEFVDSEKLVDVHCCPLG